MKKAFILLAAFAVCGAILTASAHQAGEHKPAYKILGIAEPSLLPDSGFYFFKEIGRGFKRLFTFDTVKKAELELEIADEKLAELDKTAVKSAVKEEAINKALGNYLEAQERLARRLESLKGKNKNVDTLLEKLADRVVRHEELFNDLEDKLKEGEVKKVEKEIAKAAKKALELDEKKFKEKLKARIEREKEDDDEELEAIEDLIAADEELEGLEEDLDEILADAKKSAAEAELEDSEEEIEAAEDRVKEAKLTGKNEDEALRLLAEAKKHWGFAKSELEKKNYEQVKVHLGHVSGFLKDLENILATGKKSKDLGDCGPRPGAPGNWVCKDKGWQLVEEKPQEPVLCTQQYEPVCGVNGKTYSNECRAKAAGVKPKYAGTCGNPEPSPAEACDFEYKPVCGSDNKTYANKCFATIVGVIIKHDGTCQEKANTAEPTILTDKSEYKHGDTIGYTIHNNSSSNIFVLGGQNNLEYVEKKNADGTWTRYGLTKLPQAPPPPGTDPYVSIPPKENKVSYRWVGWLINIQNDQILDIVPGTYRLIIFYVTSKQLPGFSEALSNEFQMKTGEPNAQEFKLEADDYGFYPSNILTVTKGAKVKITFTVRATNVYYAGLDFRSSKFATAAAKPGEMATVEFTADEPFIITSYWPLSGVKKAELKVEVE